MGGSAGEQGTSPGARAAAPPRAPILPPQEGKNPPVDLVLLGEFGRAHGLKGEVRLKSYTDDPQAIADYAPLVGSVTPNACNRNSPVATRGR